MISFQIKSSLALGLTHRMRTMDGQIVADACAGDVISNIRDNISIADEIDKANAEFVSAVEETEKKKRAVLEEMKAEYEKGKEGKTPEESSTLAKSLTAKFNERAAEIQKESKANPDTLITVEIGNEKYQNVLLPVFKKTVQLWDVNGDGKGQQLFLEVADALEAIKTY